MKRNTLSCPSLYCWKCTQNQSKETLPIERMQVFSWVYNVSGCAVGGEPSAGTWWYFQQSSYCLPPSNSICRIVIIIICFLKRSIWTTYWFLCFYQPLSSFQRHRYIFMGMGRKQSWWTDCGWFSNSPLGRVLPWKSVTSVLHASALPAVRLICSPGVLGPN